MVFIEDNAIWHCACVHRQLISIFILNDMKKILWLVKFRYIHKHSYFSFLPRVKKLKHNFKSHQQFGSIRFCVLNPSSTLLCFSISLWSLTLFLLPHSFSSLIPLPFTFPLPLTLPLIILVPSQPLLAISTQFFFKYFFSPSNPLPIILFFIFPFPRHNFLFHPPFSLIPHFHNSLTRDDPALQMAPRGNIEVRRRDLTT